jgi:hypothetical protein
VKRSEDLLFRVLVAQAYLDRKNIKQTERAILAYFLTCIVMVVFIIVQFFWRNL